MKPTIILFKKEVIDNLRDKRTLFNSLLFGPILGPLLLALMMNFIINMQLDEFDQEIELGGKFLDRAPHLVQFLQEQNITFTDVANSENAVVEREQIVVLEIPDDYQENFAQGKPAPVELYFDQSSSKTSKKLGRIERALQQYDKKISVLRMMARGIDPNITSPLNIRQNDLSTPESRAILILGMISYVLFAVLLSGGLYLAIDSTAGERERHSLEPLLSLPVTKESIVFGKLLACIFFMMVALAIALISFKFSVPFMPLEKMNISSNLDWPILLQMFVIILPFIVLSAAIMILVASFTNSYKEAQTYLTVVILVPIIPILIASVMTLEPSLPTMFAPALSQHLLVSELIKNMPINMGYALIATISTLVLSLIVIYAVIRLYKREKMLG